MLLVAWLLKLDWFTLTFTATYWWPRIEFIFNQERTDFRRIPKTYKQPSKFIIYNCNNSFPFWLNKSTNISPVSSNYWHILFSASQQFWDENSKWCDTFSLLWTQWFTQTDNYHRASDRSSLVFFIWRFLWQQRTICRKPIYGKKTRIYQTYSEYQNIFWNLILINFGWTTLV